MHMDIGSLHWTLVGWEPNAWAYLREDVPPSPDADLRRFQCTPEIPAQVPGAVQEDLLRAGLLPDWNEGLNARLCEWVEHRHWEYRCQVEVPASWEGERILLRAEGLDYQGHVFVDDRPVGSFRGTLVPHEFDLSDHLRAGQVHRLSILFEGAPHEQGQMGYTSRSRCFKPRYAYGWDWCPRMVPLGIWDRLTLRTVAEMRLHGCLPSAEYDLEAREGRLSVRLDVTSPLPQALQCRVCVADGDEVLCDESLSCALGPGRRQTTLSLSAPLPVEPWWPNGLGEQKLYSVSLALVDEHGQEVDAWQGRVGFKRVRWLPCEGAPANATPWICEINGQTLFLQGVNWSPVRITYGSVTEEQYRERLELYVDMGLNALRVWGGAILETEAFYDLCDELGLLVWQEFPLSSSGAENIPPHDPGVLAELSRIAASYVWRRGGHACLFMWGGGNELAARDARRTPVDESHPAIAAMAGITNRLTPQVRFVPTSPSGPSFSFDPQQAGLGLHHDIHGPWVVDSTMDEWKAWWDQHDALLVSEVGAPSCSPVDILERYAGGMDLWPPSMDNPYWRYRSPWWVLWEHMAADHGFTEEVKDLARYVRITQEEQAEALAYMAASCKRRFPRCGGVFTWMGHDCFPCPSNTSIVDYDGRPKPAVEAMKAVYRQPLRG